MSLKRALSSGTAVWRCEVPFEVLKSPVHQGGREDALFPCDLLPTHLPSPARGSQARPGPSSQSPGSGRVLHEFQANS